MRLKGKVSIVTGGSQGIGEYVARRLGQHGSNIVIADINEEAGVVAIEKLRSEHGIDAIFIRTDVGEEESVQNMIQKTVKQYGGIDALVNNAGLSVRKSVMETSLAEWQKLMHVNLQGTFLCSKYTIPEIAKRGGGSIVNIASLHAYKTITRLAAYAASKGAITALTRQMALDCGQYNIRVNAVCPGSIDTPMLHNLFSTLPDPKEAFEQSWLFNPLGELAMAKM